MNKAWFFGDSFTYGHGCKPGYEYYDKHPNDIGNIWTEIIAEELGLEEKNFGIPGNSNPNLIKQILENLVNFEQGDIVILSNTLPIRSVLYNHASNEIAPITSDLAVWPDKNPGGEHFLDRFYKDKTESIQFLDYLYSFKLPYEKHWTEYYLKQILGIQSFLVKFNVEAYFWAYETWVAPSPYEIISNATKGKIIDGHWSWKGHKEFSNYLLERVHKQEYLHNPQLI